MKNLLIVLVLISTQLFAEASVASEEKIKDVLSSRIATVSLDFPKMTNYKSCKTAYYALSLGEDIFISHEKDKEEIIGLCMVKLDKQEIVSFINDKKNIAAK